MGGTADQWLQLAWRPFELPLPQPLRTARGTLRHKCGWLLRLSADHGAVGWGEAAPLELDQGCASPGTDHSALSAAVAALDRKLRRRDLETLLRGDQGLPSLAFALGAALAELDGLVGTRAGGWLPAPAPAGLLPAGAAAIGALEQMLARLPQPPAPLSACFKWKVAVHADAEERQWLEALLQRLPAQARLRVDANGGWDRSTAGAWAERLATEPRLQWLEQPLPPGDLAGLEALAQRLPVALDESLMANPDLRQRWPGWQVRRPSQDGDPRPLLADLLARRPRLMLSTAFETGIGRRWLHHLAGLQARGPTPAAPGLASDWQGSGPLLSSDPRVVWEAAA